MVKHVRVLTSGKKKKRSRKERGAAKMARGTSAAMWSLAKACGKSGRIPREHVGPWISATGEIIGEEETTTP